MDRLARDGAAFSRCGCIRVLRHATLLKALPRREAERREARSPEAASSQTSLRSLRKPSAMRPPPPNAPCKNMKHTEGARLSALHRGACPANQCRGSVQAVFPGTCGVTGVTRRRYPSPAGHPADRFLAGRSDAQTAREQGYEPCPQEPHPPRLKDRL